MKQIEHFGPIASRVLLASIFAMVGLNKIGAYTQIQGCIEV